MWPDTTPINILIGALASIIFTAGLIYGLRRYAIAVADKRMAAFQNDFVMRYYDEVRHMYYEMRGWRHDYRTHIQTLRGYAQSSHNEKILRYLSQMDEDLTQLNTLLNTGNETLNAIMNAKLSLAAAKDIPLHAKVNAPACLSVSEMDLCIIIGNLMDNAVEACEKITDKNDRFIRVYMDVKHAHLYISVMNATNGRPRQIGGVFKTDKAGFHGFGLLRIDRLVAKYGGYCYRAGEDGVFTTEITIPIMIPDP